MRTITVKERREALAQLADDMPVVVPVSPGAERNGDYCVALSVKAQELPSNEGYFTKKGLRTLWRGTETTQVLVIS